MRSFLHPPGEGDRVRIDEPKRLRALAQEVVDEGGLPSTVRPGEADEGGYGLTWRLVAFLTPTVALPI